MNRNQLSIFKAVVFICGLGVIALAYALSGGINSMSDAFMWLSIVTMYILVFCSLLFVGINHGGIAALTMLWLGIGIYVPVSVIFIVLLKVLILPLKAAIVLQAILVFLFLLNFYFGVFASSHAGNVAAGEKELKLYLNEIKQKAQELLITASGLPAEFDTVQKLIAKSAEDLRYISPVNDPASLDSELAILASLNKLGELCELAINRGTPKDFEVEAQKLQALIRRRKLLRN